ncbi:Gfo/Idh/MocA family oxidoreductase [Luteolibacter sp. GHJ8]|uniref:Gfo/Idh/MocA family oxidoreductase n=1 Tax=Luteolibacter rhizosphaerae TaxID=2989719 RepID=A0ABT3G2E4_9BACT|nr:Gfo/Idh/MocA family oxidoreductase [Luteolibacter rhizosphaerae]MCW1913995.1 Gfo/Idh/MocA family oxidoreductase [Luteolibacter rhizosphaerae]
MNRKLRMGMVGGGRGAFIGGVHRMAANLDGKIELVAGCFSSDPEKSKLSGEDLFLDPSRVYTSHEEMAKAEAALPADKRIDFVSIVVRNNLHVPVSKAFLAAGINVICDKPMALSLAEAKEFADLVKKSGKVFALTHNYTGYPMVKEARAMVKAGKLGRLLKVVAEYPQGYASSAFKEAAPSKIANWRMDPNVSGVSNCMGDIGSHAENLARYITGLEIEELAAELTTYIPGRTLDDDGNVLVRYQDGVKGIIYASQVSTGDENNLNIRVYGTEGSIEWHQEHPNELVVKFLDKPREIWRRGNSYNGPEATAFTRLPFGHPEAFIEAFANIYLAASEAIRDELAGKFPRPEGYDFPSVDDGVAGMAFIEATVKSAQNNAAWTKPGH